MKLSAFKIDTARAEAGDWIEVKAIRGLAFKVRGVQTVAAKAHRAKLHASIDAADRSDREVMMGHEARIEREMALWCLMDWRGMEADDGSALPYSPETARALIMDPDFERLMMLIASAALEVRERKADAIEDAAKN